MPSSRRIIAEREAGLRWYVARTSPRAEYAVAEKLRRDGYETFVPCIQTEGPRSGRLGGPLFPGYLFLRYGLAAWGPEALDRVGRLLGLVTFGGMAPPVPDEDMEELRRRVDALNQWHGCCPARPGERGV